MPSLAAEPSRSATLDRALRLEYLTVGWNVVEGVVAVAAAAAAGSVALLGFGLDSFVECASGLILVWRLRAERGASELGRERIEALDRRAHRLVGVSLFLLAAWIAYDSADSLLRAERPDASPVGLVLVVVSMALMLWLARAKRAAAGRLGSRALAADAVQTYACWWLSVVTLLGLGANAAFSWWWADPLAAVGVAVFVVREGREAWRGEECC